MSNQYLNFLKRLYDELQSLGIITKKVSSAKEKVQVVLDYGEKLKKIQNKSAEKEEYLRRIKALYYKRYIVKESDIPSDYFEHLSEMYLAEGYGHLNLVNPKSYLEKGTRKQHVKQIIDAQKASLDTWLDYLMSSDSNYIDVIYKIWAFQGMLSIGTLNKKLDGYNRRDKNTIAPFVNLNSEILGKSVLYLKMHLKEEVEEYPDEETKRLASSESFYQIYGKLLAKEKTIKKNGDEGIWVKYQGFNEEEALKLYNDLQGYNTGWCTASDKKTAINQVCGGGTYLGGDFYVYYSKDVKNEYKIPRIAIRMERDKIGEIRGILSGQNIEIEMVEILDEKLREFPDSEKYKKKMSDKKKLTRIYKKHQLKEELTIEELRFLYEIDSKIEGFGYQVDPRIEEIRSERNKKADYIKILNLDCTVEEFGMSPESIKGKKFKYYYGNLYLEYNGNYDDVPENVIGDVNFLGVEYTFEDVMDGKIDEYEYEEAVRRRTPTSISNIKLPITITGDLVMPNLVCLKSIKGLVLPKSIGGALCLYGIRIENLLEIESSINAKEIRLSDGKYSLEELKNLMAIKKEKLDLEAKKSIVQNNIATVEDNLKKGNINIWYILIPAFTLVLGIVIASIIYKI